VLFVVLIPILGFFFLKDGHELREQVLGLVKAERRPMWEDIVSDVHALLGQFIRALVLLALATFTACSIFFASIGLPYALLLATVAGALEVIPVVGPLVGAVTIVLVAAFSGFGHVLVILAFLAAYRIFQDYILSPHLMSSGVALHPLLVIFGALSGEALAGIPGMFLSVPVLATLRVIYVRIRKARQLEER
jgi:predicted PurR-regulated permease PerM